MDPNSCLWEILDMLRDQDDADRDQICLRLENLATWLTKGGFMPSVTREATESRTFTVTKRMDR